MFISNDSRYIGVNAHQGTLFEVQYDVPLGMAYNSYVILDEKIAVMDTVDAHFGKEWLANLTAALAGRTPDYLVVQHMEPDHSANIAAFMDAYPAVRTKLNRGRAKLRDFLLREDNHDETEKGGAAWNTISMI